MKNILLRPQPRPKVPATLSGPGQEITDQYTKKIEELAAAKEKERRPFQVGSTDNSTVRHELFRG
jgi:hypothetical protein